MSDALNEILNEALPAWAKLTGTKLGDNSYTISFSNSEYQDYHLKHYVEDLNDARSRDLTGTTAILLLRGLFEGYVREKSFKAHALLYEASKVAKTIDKLRAFHALITKPACEEAVTAFRETLRAAAVHYGYDLVKLQEQLADESALAYLRLGAARSLERLATHQFTQGTRDTKPLQYNRQIFEFSSVNSFVHALRRQMVSGITLALIRPGDVYKAYFMLGLRNGETTTILTDFKDGAHPEYHNVTRRPDRRLEERAKEHWFPYRLLEEKPIKRAQRKHALVPLDVKAAPIEQIENLEPAEFIWLILLFGLIAEKFDREDYKTPQLSYTGEMIVAPHALVDAQSALVRTGQYVPLVLPKLTTTTTTPELAGNEKPVGHNAWLEDRYRDRVPEILLDVVGDRKALEVGKAVNKLLPGAKITRADLPDTRSQPGVIVWGGTDYRLAPLDPKALDPSYFGTATEVEQTRAWYARVNLIKGVQRFATAEFVAKHKMIMSWFRKRLERNMAFIWKAVAVGELVAPIAIWKSDADRSNPFPSRDELIWETGNILEQKQERQAYGGGSGIRFGEWSSSKGRMICALDAPTPASVYTSIEPNNARALAVILGIPEKKIPWPLQHWTTLEPYTGNSILDRVDPQDSRLDNPWRHLELQINIALCKSAFNRLRKEHGLPPKTFAKENADD